MSTQIQSSTNPPARPFYILRGHSAAVHAVHFLRSNLRLLSGDADGWVVLWDTPTRRAVAVWKAHAGPILGLGSWEEDKIVTHGRDNALCVWKITPEDEPILSKALPIDDLDSERKQPWLLHNLTVNALNFCSFAACPDLIAEPPLDTAEAVAPILIATPGAQDGYINVTSLPSEARVATIPSPPSTKTGMTMAIGLSFIDNELIIVAGYESGHAAVWTQNPSSKKWQVRHLYQSHTQPILSLEISPNRKSFFATSADAIISRSALLDGNAVESKTVQTRHAGQQGLKIRSDGKIFATAGWDGRVRVYSTNSMQELAVLKWHKEGCYTTAFAYLIESSSTAAATTGTQDTHGSMIKRDLTVSEQRTEKAKTMHLLAAGSKDGKVSLWDVY